MNMLDKSGRHPDVAVIGAGLIGSAAAKYLSKEGANVTLIGAEAGNRHGIHASHYDEARITRLTSPDAVWAHLAHASQQRYASIEEESGIQFHSGCGHLRADLPTILTSWMPFGQEAASCARGFCDPFNNFARHFVLGKRRVTKDCGERFECRSCSCGVEGVVHRRILQNLERLRRVVGRFGSTRAALRWSWVAVSRQSSAKR